VSQHPAGQSTLVLAGRIVSVLARRGQTVAVAESLTGGLLAAALVEVPGASAVFRGGIVAYATDLKVSLLGVAPSLLERHGAVHPEVAAAMAGGVRRRLGATFGLATTGVAGPDPVDGQPVGTVYIAASRDGGDTPQGLRLDGDRARIRHQTVVMSLKQLAGMLDDEGALGKTASRVWAPVGVRGATPGLAQGLRERSAGPRSTGPGRLFCLTRLCQSTAYEPRAWEEDRRLQRYVHSEHSGVRSRRLSVRTGTVEA
jgi:nicotinamide-nucleotide amidase